MLAPATATRTRQGCMTAQTRDDHEVIRACLEGSQEAFTTLVKRHEERSFWAAYRVVGDAEAARDTLGPNLA